MQIAIAIVALLFAASIGLVAAGIWMLAGAAWTMIWLGVALFGAAAHLRSGLR